jgi:hypothetical protein
MSDPKYRTWDEVKAEAAANRTPEEQAAYEAEVERLKNLTDEEIAGDDD